MGPNVYPGCGRVRNGQMKYLKRVSRVECNDPLIYPPNRFCAQDVDFRSMVSAY